MKKVIVLRDNSEIKIGNIVFNKDIDSYCLITLVNDKTSFMNCEHNGKIMEIETENIELENVYFYITNTEDVIKQNDWICNKRNLIKILLKSPEQSDIKNHNYYKVIATNDPSLPIPQLSKSSIDLIIKHNGEIDNFDIDFGNGNTSCCNCSWNSKFEPDTCKFIKECVIDNKHFIPIAYIILKESIQSVNKYFHCNAYKANPYGLCPDCGKFPTKLHLDMINKVLDLETMNERETNTHLSHCFQGEYKCSCKYGEYETCPANPKINESNTEEDMFDPSYPIEENYPEIVYELYPDLSEEDKDWDKMGIEQNNINNLRDAFIKGANYQKKQDEKIMYDEIEVKNLFIHYIGTIIANPPRDVIDGLNSFMDWFNENKK